MAMASFGSLDQESARPAGSSGSTNCRMIEGATIFRGADTANPPFAPRLSQSGIAHSQRKGSPSMTSTPFAANASRIASDVAKSFSARADCRRSSSDSISSRSEEHTSELQSLMRNSYAVFCLKKKKNHKHKHSHD